MEKEITHLKQIVLSLPEKPGVYQYLNAKDEIIYVEHKQRVKQHIEEIRKAGKKWRMK